MIRLLRDGDQPALEEFLARHADSSMFLLANSRKAGLVDGGLPFQATYAGAFEEGSIVAVAAHSWLGTVLVQAPLHLQEVVRAAVAASGRRVTGVLGPYGQAVAAARSFGDVQLRQEGRELLYALDLCALHVPAALERGEVSCRRPFDDELPLLTDWRVDYVRETKVEQEGPDLRARCAISIELLHADEADFVLERAGVPVSYCCYNARIAEAVQIGGVWTPVALRGRGYARCVVAGALQSALARGASRAILFTPESNLPARRSYEALGFSVVGDYG
ncbi:MAG TPA: GNAT family N-acetyltransferase, partial [Myxococcales bacterium]|nr:GNAT family N-acetyltransferase [Myxococcales bacterium]